MWRIYYSLQLHSLPRLWRVWRTDRDGDHLRRYHSTSAEGCDARNGVCVSAIQRMDIVLKLI